jgi:hypothetical protein
MSQLEQILSNAGNGQTVGGEIGMDDLAALQKSLSAGYGTDVAALTGGGAFRIQSLDTTMQATVQDNKHFVLFNKLPKPKATATVDEWTEQSGIGGFLGGTTNTEDGDAAESQGDYARMVGKVKYLSTYRKIPIVLQSQNNIVDATAQESTNGAKQLLTDIEFLSFEGNELIVPTEFDGIKRQLEALGSVDNIIDMGGAALNSIDAISKAAETIWGIDSFGTATDIIMAASVQTDLNNSLDPAFRIALTKEASSIQLGTHVSGIQTAFGAIKTNQDVFVRDERMQKIFQVRGGQHASIAAANDVFKPTVAAAANASGGASTKFDANTAGNYYYAVCGINAKGQSTAALSAQVAVAAAGKATLTITASAGGSETGYVIYRSRKNGTNGLTDFREMVRVPKAGATTVVDDLNRDIPGSTNAYVLNLNPADHAISWKQYLPMMKIPLAATRSPIIPWMQMICGYLRITKRRQHVLIKNIVPTGAAWKPFA